jgi:hypothetical protein
MSHTGQEAKSRCFIQSLHRPRMPAKAKERSGARGYQTKNLSEHTSSRTLLVARDEGQYDLVVGVRGLSWNGVR